MSMSERSCTVADWGRFFRQFANTATSLSPLAPGQYFPGSMAHVPVSPLFI